MLDAAGHMILSVVRGQFSVHPVDAGSVEVRFYDLVELDPYRNHEPLRELEPSSIRVTREEGVFAFRHHKSWWVPKDTALLNGLVCFIGPDTFLLLTLWSAYPATEGEARISRSW